MAKQAVQPARRDDPLCDEGVLTMAGATLDHFFWFGEVKAMTKYRKVILGVFVILFGIIGFVTLTECDLIKTQYTKEQLASIIFQDAPFGHENVESFMASDFEIRRRISSYRYQVKIRGGPLNNRPDLQMVWVDLSVCGRLKKIEQTTISE